MSFLVLRGLTKRFRSETVFQDLSLTVARGETVVIFGPSGAGKTVLLRLITGTYEPDEGGITIGGEPMDGVPPDARDVGMAFQNFALYPHLPAFENIASPLRARRLPEPEVRERVAQVAELLRISHVLDHLPKALSNGQKQRTALARALVRSPQVLLLDDPLRNVDAKLRYEMRLELPRLLRRTEATVLYVTQDYKEAMALGDRVGVLINGRLRQVAPPADIYASPVGTDVARLFGDPTINLYPCRPQADGDGVAVELFGARFPLDRRMIAAAGRECLLGLRPEHVKVETTRHDGGLPVELDAVTPLNVRAVMLLRTRSGQEILATCGEDEAAALPRGHRDVMARFDLDHALLFDRESGERITPALN